MENKLKSLIPLLLNIFLFFVCSLFMYNAYKCISGFVANNADDGLFMITMITSYFLPVICYFFFFYKNYVKDTSKTNKLVYSIIVSLVAIFNLVNIFININIYTANNVYGIYEAIPSIVIAFPYDMILVNIILIILQILNIYRLFKKDEVIEKGLSYVPRYGYFKFHIAEYVLICVIAVLGLFFFGNFLISFKAIRNVLHDPKYIYLLIWILSIPTINLFALVFKVENRNISIKNKNIYLIGISLINVILTALLFIFETLYPNFIVYIGKPMFPITFSVSLPIELIILIALAILPTIYYIIKLILINIKNRKKA